MQRRKQLKKLVIMAEAISTRSVEDDNWITKMSFIFLHNAGCLAKNLNNGLNVWKLLLDPNYLKGEFLNINKKQKEG